MVIDGKKYTPVKDYANIKKCTVQHVYNMIKRGDLQSKKIGTYTLVAV